MSFITKNEARTASSKRSNLTTAKRVLAQETFDSANDIEKKYDIFLSHSSEDAEIVLGVKQILSELGLTVYVDWIDDAQLDRRNVTVDTAGLLRTRMKNSSSMLLVTTKNAAQSKWIPWELGYFDGISSGGVAILPVLDNGTDNYEGQEYLGLYPVVERIAPHGLFVKDRKLSLKTLGTFVRGARP